MIKKAYIIDDDEISIYVTSLILEVTEFAEQIRPFASVDEAYGELLRESDESIPEIILLDLNMPVKNGWDFLDMLHRHQQELLGKSSVFILTSSIDDAEIRKSEDYSLVAGFLHKPLDEESIDMIRNTLNQIRQ